MAVASQNDQLHFLIVPLMSQSHLIPMTDFAMLLAKRGLVVTIITTPLNSTRYKLVLDGAIQAGLQMRQVSLPFPCQEAGLPQGCENMDSLTSPDLIQKFFQASEMLQKPMEELVLKLEPRVSCVISSNALPWTAKIARKFDIPRYVFNALSCFTLLCSHNLSLVDESSNLDSETILVPNMPDKIEFTKAQLPEPVRRSEDKLNSTLDQMKKAEVSSQGIIVNTFEEMEKGYVEEYKKINKNTWYIGPVSLSNKERSEKFSRGNKASIDEHFFLKWLDSKKPGSVVYACFGSLCHIPFPQLVEIGLGLEASNHPFVWVIRGCDYSEELNKWMREEEFEERNEGKGLIIRGWAPQVMILSHRSVGGFLTHCGWNSTLEGICAGVPMITWPMFAEQFYNEKLVTHVLRIGVRIGVEVGMQWDKENVEVLVKREQVKKAIELLMSEEEEGRERRRRALEFGEMANRATEEGGSSYLNISFLIEDVMQQLSHKNSAHEQQYSLCHPHW